MIQKILLAGLCFGLVACGPNDASAPEPTASTEGTAPNTNSSDETSSPVDTAFSVEAEVGKLQGCWDGEVNRIVFKTEGKAKGQDLAQLYYPKKTNVNDFNFFAVNFSGNGTFIRNKDSSAAQNYTYKVEGDTLQLGLENADMATYTRCK